ncbi:MAG: hypothetical protein QM727_00695 [Niabella sp.]
MCTLISLRNQFHYIEFCRGRCYHLPQANGFLNGNILKIWQKGPAGESQQLIDDLTYTYIPGTNKLLKVKDAVTANYGLGDFNDGTNGDNNDYLYDVNGNLTQDLNKILPLSSIIF